VTKGLGGVGVVNGDRGGAFFTEGAGLVDEFFGEVEGGETAITEFPKAHRDAPGSATGLDEAGVLIGEEPLDEQPFGFPESERMRGACVVNDRNRVVEVVANGGGGDFIYRGQRMNGAERRPEGTDGRVVIPES